MTQVFQAGVIGPAQIIIIVVVIILLFGGKKIPELMRGIGQGMTVFKKATRKNKEDKDTKTKQIKEEDAKE